MGGLGRSKRKRVKLTTSHLITVCTRFTRISLLLFELKGLRAEGWGSMPWIVLHVCI